MENRAHHRARANAKATAGSLFLNTPDVRDEIVRQLSLTSLARLARVSKQLRGAVDTHCRELVRGMGILERPPGFTWLDVLSESTPSDGEGDCLTDCFSSMLEDIAYDLRDAPQTRLGTAGIFEAKFADFMFLQGRARPTQRRDPDAYPNRVRVKSENQRSDRGGSGYGGPPYRCGQAFEGHARARDQDEQYAGAGSG